MSRFIEKLTFNDFISLLIYHKPLLNVEAEKTILFMSYEKNKKIIKKDKKDKKPKIRLS
jgi:hypothetical protein